MSEEKIIEVYNEGYVGGFLAASIIAIFIAIAVYLLF